MGAGDEMIYVAHATIPVIHGTGTEDYFCRAWDFGGKNGATPFAHLYNGAPMIASPERQGGRYCLYRWHADNPVTFQKSLQAHHRARSRQRPRRLLLFCWVLVPVGAVHRLPHVARAGRSYLSGEKRLTSGTGILG